MLNEKDKEVILKIIDGVRSINREKFAFFIGVYKSVKEYVYLTKDNYFVYYSVDNKEVEIQNLTEKIQIKKGALYRWDKSNKRFEKAVVRKIESVTYCEFFRNNLLFKKKINSTFADQIGKILFNKV